MTSSSPSTSLSKSNKFIVPILSVLLLLSILLLVKEYYFNRTFYNPTVNDESQLNNLLTKDNIMTLLAHVDTEDAGMAGGAPGDQMGPNPVKTQSLASKKRASEMDAENCNSQGFYYTDINACNCFSCFSGTSCQNFDDTCMIDDGGGNPLLFEQYWRNISASDYNATLNDQSTAIEEIYYRAPYQMMTMSKINLTAVNTSNNSFEAIHARLVKDSAETRNKEMGKPMKRKRGRMGQRGHSAPLGVSEESPSNAKPSSHANVNKYHSSASSGSGFLMPYLVNYIGLLHQYVGNIANLDSKYVVLGSGATELIGAAMYACNEMNKLRNEDTKGKGRGRGAEASDTTYVYAKVPYYEGYSGNLLSIGVENLEFSTDSSLNADNVVEFVTYPNNPTNTFREPTYDNALCTIHDQVYWWPSLSNLTEGGAPLDTKVSLFSFSKVTGHGGSRLGWALVDDYETAALMAAYIESIQIHISIDTQYRAFRVFSYLLGDASDTVVNADGSLGRSSKKNADLFFDWVRDQLSARWVTLNSVFNASTSGKYIQEATPGAFYAWIRCTDESTTCVKQFESAGISPVNGENFGSDSSYVRLELVTSNAIWDIVVDRLKTLIGS